jgi:uncharacterized C2H2 Zn-finger protein
MKKFRKTKDGFFICEECNKTFKNMQRLSVHIKNEHKYKKYYDKWLKEKGEGLCKSCGKKTLFISFKKQGYKKTCCSRCMGLYNSSKLTSKSIEKRKQTNKEKYGYTAFNNKKGKQTKLEKYGNENYNNHEKYKQTCQEKWGVDNVFQVEEIKEKSKQTCLKNNGVEYSLQSNEIRGRGKQTKKEKYGNENYNNREKSKQTCLKNNGVEWCQQNIEIFLKTQKTRFKINQYKDTNLYYRASFELDFLNKFYSLYQDIQNGPSLKYKFDEKNKIYFPDFYIPSLNLIVECKNSYLVKKDKKQIKAKERAAIASGFNYIMIVDKDYNQFNSFITLILSKNSLGKDNLC